jgi:hypothetical protein
MKPIPGLINQPKELDEKQSSQEALKAIGGEL